MKIPISLFKALMKMNVETTEVFVYYLGNMVQAVTPNLLVRFRYTLRSFKNRGLLDAYPEKNQAIF